MTTHNQHQDTTEFTTAPADFGDSQGTSAPTGSTDRFEGQPASAAGERLAPDALREQEADRTGPPIGSDDGRRAATATHSSADALFAERDLTDLRARWNDVQAAFVDDPRDCVQKADGLVSDTVEQLTASFTSARSRLEEQWSRGEEASTEDLRQALKRYRDFFDRLLAV
jgi:hypothetical protein